MNWDGSSLDKRRAILREFGIVEKEASWTQDNTGRLSILNIFVDPEDAMLARSLLAQMDFQFEDPNDHIEVKVWGEMP